MCTDINCAINYNNTKGFLSDCNCEINDDFNYLLSEKKN